MNLQEFTEVLQGEVSKHSWAEQKITTSREAKYHLDLASLGLVLTLFFAFNLLTLSGYQTRDSLSLHAIKKQVVCTKLSMLVLCSIILAEASWGIRRETITLQDFHGG